MAMISTAKIKLVYLPGSAQVTEATYSSHLLRGPCQPGVGGLEGNRMESCRKRGTPKKGAENMNMKSEHLPRGGD